MTVWGSHYTCILRAQHRMLRTGACLSVLPGTCPLRCWEYSPQKRFRYFSIPRDFGSQAAKIGRVIASDVGSNASDDRSEFTQAHTRSIASKMLWHIAWNCQELCIPNCLLNSQEIPRVFVKKVTIRPTIHIECFPPKDPGLTV